MKKIVLLASVLACSVAQAEPTMVFRDKANVYSLVGEGKVATKDCTVSANGDLDAVVVREGRKAWLLFIDHTGEEEGQCEVRTVPKSRNRELVAVRHVRGG